MMEEIGKEIDILAAVGRKIVISTIVEPQDLQEYVNMFESKGMEYSIILLKPAYETAVIRTQTRTCFGSVTPEEWVRYFYDRLEFDDMTALDNSGLTVEESAAAVLQMSGFVI